MPDVPGQPKSDQGKPDQPKPDEPTKQPLAAVNEPHTITIEVIRASAKVVQGIAWPITALILACMLIHFTPILLKSLSDTAKGKQSVEMGFGEKGPYVKIVEQTTQVMAGVIQQSAVGEKGQPTGPIPKEDVQRIARITANAVVETHARGELGAASKAKILWVDDHPENNAGLQSAFEALGMKVVDVKSNDEIGDAFERESRFDVVITDMARDQPQDLLAGLKTVELIKHRHPGVPVIIYSAAYATAHRGETPVAPVIAITNSPQEVFYLVAKRSP
jgi:CheY-like chemotaxis protein